MHPPYSECVGRCSAFRPVDSQHKWNSVHLHVCMKHVSPSRGLYSPNQGIILRELP